MNSVVIVFMGVASIATATPLMEWVRSDTNLQGKFEQNVSKNRKYTLVIRGLFYFFTPQFLSLISETQFYVKENNQLCADFQLIQNLEDCKLAATELTRHGSGRPFVNSPFWNPDYPKGCWQSYRGTYWNPHGSGSANEEARPICKKTEG